LQVRAIITKRVTGKQLYMSMNTLDYPVNMVTSSHVDRATHTPSYKETAVQMNIIRREQPPLPRENFRFGHRTPQHGVEVERKWRRPDYHRPEGELVQLEMTER
jgi:formate dehydrogenase major subunit